MNSDKLFQIGEVSKLSNMPVKTIRYYDEIGLLKPEQVNPKSGYRYYSHRQIMLILVIKHLKNVGFSLDEIKHLLGREDMEYNKIQIAKKYKEIDDKINDLLLLKEKIRFCLNDTSNEEKIKNEGVVKLRYVPETYVVYLRERGPVSSESFTVKYCKLWSLIEKNNLHAVKNVQAIYYDSCIAFENRNNTDFDIEVCAPVTETKEIPGIVRKFGGFNAVSAYHYGNYDSLEALYTKVCKYAVDHGYKIRGQAIDNYIVDIISTSNPDNYVTEILVPVDI